MTDGLNEMQRQAVEHPGGPLLIAAGAGSGKTRALTARLKRLIQEGTPPHEIIAITFTNKAAKEMRERVFGVESQPPGWAPNFPVPGTPFLGTFHSLGARLLKQEIEVIGNRTRNFSIVDSDGSLSMIKKILKDMDISPDRFNPRVAQSRISRIKSELEDVEDLASSGEWFDGLVAELYGKYEERLAAHNAFDFDDLLEKIVRLFQAKKKIREKYQKLFTQILVDEYQDINTVQYQLVKLLAERHKNVTVVGDDFQSIYAFRGADFRNFLNFTTTWPEAKIVKLEQNYRSTGNIVNAANAVIQQNKVQTPKKLWTGNADGELIKMVAAVDPDIEATWVANEIQNIRDKEPRAEIAILYRTNAQSRAPEQALISENIRYKIYGGFKFYDRKEVKDVLAALKIVLNHDDLLSVERLEKAFGKRVGQPLVESLVSQSKDLPPAELINWFLRECEYPEFLERKTDNPQERLENIAELTVFASRFKSLEEFLERISLLEATDDIKETKEGERPPVLMMSIHMSKGLEFDHVFLIGCNEGTLPHEKCMGKDEDVEEERRLMYVAMTRARRVLYLLYQSFPSRFLREVPREYYEFISPTGMWSELPDESDVWIEE